MEISPRNSPSLSRVVEANGKRRCGRKWSGHAPNGFPKLVRDDYLLGHVVKKRNISPRSVLKKAEKWRFSEILAQAFDATSASWFVAPRANFLQADLSIRIRPTSSKPVSSDQLPGCRLQGSCPVVVNSSRCHGANVTMRTLTKPALQRRADRLSAVYSRVPMTTLAAGTASGFRQR